MKNLLLGIIAINLTFISFNLALRSIEPVQAQLSEKDMEIVVKYSMQQCYVPDFYRRLQCG